MSFVRGVDRSLFDSLRILSELIHNDKLPTSQTDTCILAYIYHYLSLFLRRASANFLITFLLNRNIWDMYSESPISYKQVEHWVRSQDVSGLEAK